MCARSISAPTACWLGGRATLLIDSSTIDVESARAVAAAAG
jgi:3-hydroxyisobutyrate dehydrogenase-like beta-hydroxyacid dehydrogenase